MSAADALGVPALFGFQLYRHRDVLHLPGPQWQLGFLYEEYRPLMLLCDAPLLPTRCIPTPYGLHMIAQPLQAFAVVLRMHRVSQKAVFLVPCMPHYAIPVARASHRLFVLGSSRRELAGRVGDLERFVAHAQIRTHN